MKPRTTIAAVLLAIGAAVAWLVSGRGLGDAPRTPHPLERPTAAAPQRRGAPIPHLARDAVESGERTLVRVVDDATDRPVVDAEVRAYDLRALSAALADARLPVESPRARELQRTMSRSWRTDSTGTVAIAQFAARLVVQAHHGARWGVATAFGTAGSVVEVRIGPDHDLRVRVTSATGEPQAGVPVALRRRPLYQAAFQDRTTLTEAPAGIAKFQHVQRRFAQGDGWQVTLAFPLAPQPVVGLAPNTLPTAPIELQLRASGSLSIEVRDGGAGRAVTDNDIRLVVAASTSPDAFEPIYPGGRWSRPKLDAAGFARVPWLGLGLHLRVTATAADARDPTTPQTVDVRGPVTNGEIVTCTLTWPNASDESFPIVTGRFVRSDGTPWPRSIATVEPRTFPYFGGHAVERLEIESDGGFRLVVRCPLPSGGRRTYRIAANDGAASVLGEVDLTRDLPVGITDLGDVLLDHGALLARGRVVDERGSPLARAFVRAISEVRGTERYRPLAAAGIARTGADGRFELFAQPTDGDPPAWIGLRCDHDDYATAEVDGVAVGDDRVEIRMTPGGTIAGSIALEPDQTARGFEVFLLGESSGSNVIVAADGSFEVDGLTAGPYRLSIGIAGGGPSRVIDGLVVVSGETCRDPRIQSIRLDATTERVTVRIVDSNGAPVASARIRAEGADDARSTQDGRAVVCGVTPPARLQISAFGHRPSDVEVVRDETTIVLQHGLAARIECAGPTQGTEPDFHIALRFAPVADDGRARGTIWPMSTPLDRLYVDADGALPFRFPAPGEYEVQPSLFVAGTDHVGRGGPLRIEPPLRITVVDTAQLQTFRIAIPERVLADGLQRYAR